MKKFLYSLPLIFALAIAAHFGVSTSYAACHPTNIPGVVGYCSSPTTPGAVVYYLDSVGDLSSNSPISITASGTPAISGVANALVTAAANGGLSAFAGSSPCSAGQFVTGISATGTVSCRSSASSTTATVTAGVGVSVSFATSSSNTTSTVTLNINNGSLQSCASGQLVNSLSATGTITCLVTINTINGLSTSTLTIAGTANQINVTSTGNTVTLSLPQSLSTSSSPTFNGLTLNGNISGTKGTFGADSISGSTSTPSFFSNVDTILFANATSGAQDYDAYLNGLCASSLLNASGSLIVVPQGTWNVSTSIVLNGRCSFMGAGGNGTILNWQGAQGTTLITYQFPTLNNEIGGGFQGFTFLNGGSATTTNPSIAIDMNGGSNNLLGGAHSITEFNLFKNWGLAIRAATGTYGEYITNNSFRANGQLLEFSSAHNSGETPNVSNNWGGDEANATTSNCVVFEVASVEDAYVGNNTWDNCEVVDKGGNQINFGTFETENTLYATDGSGPALYIADSASSNDTIDLMQVHNDSNATSTSYNPAVIVYGSNLQIKALSASFSNGVGIPALFNNLGTANDNIHACGLVPVNAGAYTKVGSFSYNAIPTTALTGCFDMKANSYAAAITTNAANQMSFVNGGGNAVTISIPGGGSNLAPYVGIGNTASGKATSTLDVGGTWACANDTISVSTTIPTNSSGNNFCTYYFTGSASSTLFMPTTIQNRFYGANNQGGGAPGVNLLLQATSTDIFNIRGTTTTSYTETKGDSSYWQYDSGTWVSQGPLTQTYATPSIGGGSLTAGTCASTTIAIDSSVVSTTASLDFDLAVDPGPDFYTQKVWLSQGNISVRVCAAGITGTPNASVGVLKVIR